MKMIYLGPPGAGKGTMAKRTKELLAVPHISTGDLFRWNVGNKTPLGLKVNAIIEQGDLVPDTITVAMVRERLTKSDSKDGYILDGFPRTIAQAESLSEITTVDHVINLECSNDELIRRLTGRRSCPVCSRIYHIAFMPPKEEGQCDDGHGSLTIRPDDTINAVKNRLLVYAESTAPLVDWYTKQGLIRNIDATAHPDVVFHSIQTILEQ